MELAAATHDILHWQSYLMLSSFLLLFPPTFTALFCCNKLMSILFIEAFALSWEIVLRDFLEISPIGNSYCKKKYSKDEVNVVEITQITLQNMRKNLSMASFSCLAGKIWKKIVLCFYKKGKNARFVLFSKQKKTNKIFVAFLCRFAIKYSLIFFSTS